MINYMLKYFSEYQNKNNFFRLEILQNAASVTSLPIEINAYCKLSYKRADRIFTPIRGASLEININSNISNQYSEFLSFNERSYKVKFYKNTELIFEGFINPTGITQSYSSVNWVARLIATDNLGTLKNLEFIYNNELPNEFVFLDLILKRTGLNLPIAFADRILSDGQTLSNSTNRIIDPDVFLNKNNRQANCEDILKDILIKYNASICMRSLSIFDLNGNFLRNELCWFYFRNVDLINFSQNNAEIPIYKINSYDEVDDEVFGNILNPNISFLSLAKDTHQLIKSESTPGKANAILVNRNAEIRSINSLQNFRFEQKWVDLGSLIDFNNDFLDFLQNPDQTIITNQTGLQLKRSDFLTEVNGNSTFGNIGIRLNPTDENSLRNNFVKLKNFVELPVEASNLRLTGKANVKNYTFFNFRFNYQRYRMIYRSKNNLDYILKINWKNDIPVLDPNEIVDLEWELLSEANLSETNLYNNFLFFGTRFLENTDVDFDIEIPTLPEKGGFIMIEFPFFMCHEIDGIGSELPIFYNKILCEYREFNLIAEPDPELGTGEFHDAIRLNFTSTNLEDAQEVINADEPTGLFKNGLKKKTEEKLINYTIWKSAFENVEYPNLLQLTSLERLKLRRNNSFVLTSDIFGFINYGSIVKFLDFPEKYFVILEYQYDSVNDITRLEIAEIFPFGNDDNFEYKQSYIIENEVNVLIRE